MNLSSVPFTASFDLGALSDAGAERVLAPSEAERRAIAAWLGIEAIDSLKASVKLARAGGDRYSYRASFDADVVQACVITLEPVPAHISGEFRRSFQVMPRPSTRRRKAAPEPPAAVDFSGLDEDEPEQLEGPVIDLAAPVLEELSLALDPYPKAPGAAFETPAEPAEAGDNPFAVLEKLKEAPAAPGQSPKRKAKPAVRALGKKSG